jgi:TPR repeat protein
MILQGLFFCWIAMVSGAGGFFAVLAFTSFLAAFVLFQDEQGSAWFRASRLWWIPLPGAIFLLISVTLSEIASHAPIPIPAEDAKEFAELKLAAERGDAEAQLDLARDYSTGYGVAKDLPEAFRWTFNAAHQGYDEAQLALGNCYRYGYGTAIDPVAAVKWYRLAADQGLASAQSEIGNCYRYGLCVEKDLPEALKWYRMVAEQGDGFARMKADELQKEIEAQAGEKKSGK